MNSSLDWQTPAVSYTTVEMLLDDVSQQMASQNLSRYSRNSVSQRPAGSMRVVKPSSVSNSPRGSIGLNRRRTVMNDGTYRRRFAMIDHNAVAVSHDGLPAQQRTGRPVSWHPASHLNSPQVYQPPYQSHAAEATTQYQFYNYTPTSTAFSGYTSPSSAFSPPSNPYGGYEQSAYPYQGPNTAFPMDQPFTENHRSAVEHYMQDIVQQPTTYQDPTMYSHFDWNNFTTDEFENSKSAPPTPENFLPIQHPEPTLSADASMPYHSLSDDEDGKEVLVGMGLYDSPESTKAPCADPQLGNYFMMTSLFTSATRWIEQTGKGLKLEETWNPPDDEESDNDEDGDGEDGEETTGAASVKNDIEHSERSVVDQFGRLQSELTYDRESWS